MGGVSGSAIPLERIGIHDRCVIHVVSQKKEHV